MDYTGEKGWVCDCNTWNHLNTFRCSNCDSIQPYLLQLSRLQPQPPSADNSGTYPKPIAEMEESINDAAAGNGRWSGRRFHSDTSLQPEAISTDTEELGRGHLEPVRTAAMDYSTSSLDTSCRYGSRSGRRFLNEASLQPETLSPDEELSNMNSYLSTSDNLESGRTVAMEDSAFSLDTSLRNGRRSGRRFPGDASPHPEIVTTDEEKIPFPDKECRIVLVGKTGSGKSSTGNTILGKEEFKTDSGFSSCTRKCQWRTNLRFGVKVEVTDTPGLFDTNLDCNASREIARCLGMIVPGPHAIVVVLRLGMKFTEEETKVIDEVRKMFGEQLARYLVIVFTHGEQLHNNLTGEDSSLEALKIKLADAPDSLKRFIEGASNRCVVFSNNGSVKDKAAQVKYLLDTIRKLLSCNGGKPYTNQLLDKVENHVKKEENEINKEQRIHRSKARDIIREELENTSKSRLLDQILEELLPVLLQLCKTIILPMLVKGLLVKCFAP